MEWLFGDDALFYYGGAGSVRKYNQVVEQRRAIYGYESFKHKRTIEELEKDGFSIVKNAFPAETLANLSREFQACVDMGLTSIDNEYFTFVKDPLYNSKTSFDIATSNIIYEISSEFFKCVPSLCTQNFRLSKINTGAPNTTQVYHCDRNSYVKFIKFFIYLNDVEFGDGPLTYIKGSHKKKPLMHLSKYRWGQEEVEEIYGKDSVQYLTASAGDLLIANTTGFHRGTKPENKERRMLTLNYLVHKENDVATMFKTKRDWVDKLPNEKRPLFDFMEVL